MVDMITLQTSVKSDKINRISELAGKNRISRP